MTKDELQQQVNEATKRLAQRFAQDEQDRPPKKPPTIESVITELSPGTIIRETGIGANAGSSGGQPPPPDPGGTIDCEFSETVTGAVNGVPATLEVCTPDGTGWVTI
jgi:hypothetical protein